MKLMNISNTKKFFEMVDTCTGRVELVTDEGDRLNLKSKLTQMLSLAEVFSGGKDIPEMEIIAYEPEDVKKIMNFMFDEKRE